MTKSPSAILFDLDDTLILTHVIFTEKIDEVINFLTKKYSLNRVDLKRVLYETMTQTYHIAKVNPDKIWEMTFTQIAKDYSISTLDKEKVIEIIFRIYKTVPEMKDGAIELLKKCKQSGLKIGLVTHAKKDWTDFKIDSLGLRKYFDHIEIVDPNRYKEGSDWKKAADELNIAMHDCYIVGDNLRGDIIESNKVGFTNLIWLDKEDGWDVYRTGNLPKGTKVVKTLPEVFAYIFK